MLLYKVHKGIIMENEEEIRKAKEEIFGEPL